MKSTIKKITPPKGWISINFKEIWDYRELLVFLTWREVVVRYKQAVVGVLWVLLQPLLTVLIFSVIFGRLAKLPSDGIPYPLFCFVGLLPWQLFSASIQKLGMSLVGNANLVTKVYFPRLIIPLSAVGVGLVDFGFSAAVLCVMMAVYGVKLHWIILLVPFLVIFTVLTALSVGLWLSALNVKYRDVQHTIPFLLQIWLYASPVAYSMELIPKGPWRFIYGLNPMSGAIQGFRWAVLGGHPPDRWIFASMAIVLVLFVSGLYYFRRMERYFADVI